MAEHTKIEWCDSTWNPWIGCTKVSPACDHCYAEVSAPARVRRAAGVETWGPRGQRQRTSSHNWKQPLAWEREHEVFFAEHGRRRRVFCASLADVFDNAVPQVWRDDLFDLIAKTPNLDWLLLTKRIGNVGNMLPVPFDFEKIFPNVWLGITVCNQTEADRDIPKLLQLDVRVRFLSIEPMLGPVDIGRFMWPVCGWWKGPHRSYREAKAAGAECGLKRQGLVLASARFLDWVIVGGESGPHARPMHPDWARSLRDQCAAAGVPFLFKQWGEWIPYEDSDRPPFKFSQHGHEIDGHWLPDFESEDGKQQREWLCDWSDMLLARRVGKKAAGRLLDGLEHSGVPQDK